MQDSGSTVLGLVGLVVIAAIYFVPTIVAYARGRDSVFMIFIINLLFGWTVIGWLVSIVIAFTGESGDQRYTREMQLYELQKLTAQKEQPQNISQEDSKNSAT